MFLGNLIVKCEKDITEIIKEVKMIMVICQLES